MIKMSTDSVSTDKRVNPTMENSEDLEDGEIESDDETEIVKPVQPVKPPSPKRLKITESDSKHTDKKSYHKDKYRKSSKHSKDKKSKDIVDLNHAENNVEDDWASNVEKAIANAIRKESDVTELNLSDRDSRDSRSKDSRSRKRRKRSSKESSNKDPSTKKPKSDYPIEASPAEESIDEDELLGIRGGSPINNVSEPPKIENLPVDGNNSFESYSSGESHDSDSSRNYEDRSKRRRSRGSSRRHDRKGYKRRNTSSSRDCHPLQEPDGVCLFFMQGKCQKNDDCQYSHDAEPTRKMELCKFYLMECCAKKDKCLYLHSDFPCKFYHTGLKCFQKDDCKFAHGKPLTSELKNILLKHIETAPKEILGDFPRLSREGALNMVNAAQQKLSEQEKPQGVTKSPIPSLFELNIPKPKSLEVSKNSRSSKSSGVRKSRWCDSQYSSESNTKSSSSSSSRSQNSNHNQSYLSIQNLTGLLTSKQIHELSLLGITKLDQLNQLTVKQLNDLGISMIQINEIQLNALNLQKITNLSAINSKTGMPFAAEDGKDLDLRIPPPQLRNEIMPLDSSTKDVDMRIVHIKDMDKNNLNTKEKIKNNTTNKNEGDQYTQDNSTSDKFSQENQIQKAPVIDYSQYLKDSRLNFEKDVVCNDKDERKTSPKEKENCQETNLDNDKENSDTKSENEKIESMSNMFTNMNSAQIDRLLDSVVEDDEALQIDENLYYSDEEAEKLTINLNDESNLDNEKGEIELMDRQKEINYLPELPSSYNSFGLTSNKESIEIKSPEIEKDKTTVPFESESDVDLRKSKDTDFRCSNYGDTDLRQVRLDTDLRRVPRDTDLRDKDIDLRLTSNLEMPFKPVTQYTPASEIDGSITSHPPIVYKVYEIDVPEPDYSNIIRSIPQSQASIDPRLKKILKMPESPSSIEEPPSVVADTSNDPMPKKPRVDPRKRKECIVEVPKISPKPSVLDIQVVLQTSDWYKELSTNQKIMVNQQLAAVSVLLKQFNQDKNPNKSFDLSPIKSNPILCSILHNLGIYLTEQGQFAYLKDIMEVNKAPLMMEPAISHINIGSNSMGPNSMGPNSIGPNSMGSIGSCMNQMPPMMHNNMMNNTGGGFDNRFQSGDPRMGNGLLGIAPNMPFDGYNQNGQFNNDNYGSNYVNFGFNEQQCDEENYHFNMNTNSLRGNRNDGPHNRGNHGNMNMNNEDWNNRIDRNMGPRRNFNDRGRGVGHRPRDRGGGSRKDKFNRK